MYNFFIGLILLWPWSQLSVQWREVSGLCPGGYKGSGCKG